MSKLGIIVAREFNVRVRKRSFLVTTFLVPILIALFIGFTVWMATSSVGKEKIAIVDHTGLYPSLFKDTGSYSFIVSDKDPDYYLKAGKDNPEGVTAVLEIKKDLLEDPKAIALLGYKEIPVGVSSLIERTLSTYLTDQKLLATGIPDIRQTVKACKVTISLQSYKWQDDGSTQRSSGRLAGIIGFALSCLSFFFISTYGALVMSGVMEEKKSRIMEVMVSSVKPFDMMSGKIIGIGLVGLFQLLLWIVFGVLIFIVTSVVTIGGVYDLSTLSTLSQSEISGSMLGGGMNASDFAELKDGLSVIAGINFSNLITMFVLYFLGGYILFASLFAAVGSAVTNEEDSNQFIMPVMLLLMFSFYAGMGSMDNPEGPMAWWCSMIPFTSPVVMLVRIPYGVPVWEQVLSLALLCATFMGLIWLSAKIYRVGILMYGKKPSLKELWRWIFFK